jgi:thiamine biosynthesis protein ThiI
LVVPRRYILLVHYHELGLKGRNRPSFERKLRENLSKALQATGLDLEVARTSGRVLVYPQDYEEGLEALETLQRVPGVARVSLGEQVARHQDVINAAALRCLERAEPFDSFKVDARRANTNYPLDSMALNREVGSYLLASTVAKTVRLKEPDVSVRVEIIQNAAYVYALSSRAIGGLPVGTGGKLVCLLSSGIDSPVAAWRMLRRGAEIVGLHFSGAPETPDTSSHLVREIAAVLAPYGGLACLYTVPLGNYQRLIASMVPGKLRVIFYRRLMFAVACALARQTGAKGLVTGESLGQVASQTLDNIAAVDAVATLPVLRPLIGTDKLEIIEQAKQLGSFEISSRSTDDCCTLFMPRSPETHARLDEVEATWATLPHEAWVAEILKLL